ncbi:MAG: YqjK-like family protein [Gallionella sp.]|nr:YqjK-like family protein [Gallionella sp.]
MKKRLAALAHRRLELFEKIAAQRMEVAEISQHWQKPLAVVDTGLKAARFIRSHPGLVSGGVAALLSLRGMGIAGFARKGWRLLYLYPSILSFGLKFLSSATRSPSAEEHLAGHPEKRNTEVDY